MGEKELNNEVRRFRFPAAIAAALMVLLWGAGEAQALRCGSQLIAIGDYSFQVLEKCGEPVVKEFVGYTLTKNLKRELVIERWVYGPTAGYYDLLVFVGGELTEIRSIKR